MGRRKKVTTDGQTRYGTKESHNPIMALCMDGKSVVAVEQNIGFTKADCHKYMKTMTGRFMFVWRICELEGKDISEHVVVDVTPKPENTNAESTAPEVGAPCDGAQA